MTKVKAFRAVTYNQEELKDLSSLFCPPYDVISSDRQQYFHDLDPHNFIRILLGKNMPGEDKYKRAAEIFKDWFGGGILIQDETPSFYFYIQEFTLKGEKKTRMGFIGLLHLGEKGPSALGHEHTRIEAKEDRFSLLKAVKANLSPVFALFQDEKRVIAYIFEHYIKENPPCLSVTDDEKTVHKLWKLKDPGIIASIEAKMCNENIFIADGHHRYEVALAYREVMRQKLARTSGEEDFNYVLCYFTNVKSKGLSILPIHRLVKTGKDFDMDAFLFKLKDYFDVERVMDKVRFFFLLEKGGQAEHLLGMYRCKKYSLIRLKNVLIPDVQLKDKPKEYRSLDVSILNSLILDKILESGVSDKDNVIFSPSAQELIEKADTDSAHIAFFLNPVKVEQVIGLALKGEKMPPKTTYFYPKLLSGLVINKFS